MKKLVSVLLSLFLFAGLTACSSKKTDVSIAYNELPAEEYASMQTTQSSTEETYEAENFDRLLNGEETSATPSEGMNYIYFFEPCGITVHSEYILHQYNLDTGEWKEVFNHKVPIEYGAPIYAYSVDNNSSFFSSDNNSITPAVFNSKLFDSNVSKFATSYRGHDGSFMAGYIDFNGGFVNISEKVHPSSNDFSAVTAEDIDVAFTSNDELFFYSFPEQKCYYYDIKNDYIVKTVDFSVKPAYRHNIVLDNQDNPTLVGSDWKGRNSNIPYSVDGLKDYLTTPNGDIAFGVMLKDFQWSYIYQYGPSMGCKYLSDGIAVTPKTDYRIMDIACNDENIFFTAKKGNDCFLFKMKYDFETMTASTPELVCKIPFIYKLAFCKKHVRF